VNKPRRTHPVLYNEFDAYPAAWLRNLVRGGHIAPGVVDERSIEALTPEDVAGRTQFHAFAGIGVWSYALRLAGWPDDEPVWTASCPCQPFSSAGDGRGFDDPRHLWPAFFRLVEQCRPSILFGEQVASADGLAWLDLVRSDLEGANYALGVADLCAAGVGAPHIRQRLFWCAVRLGDADSDGARGFGGGGGAPQGTGSREGEAVGPLGDVPRTPGAVGVRLADPEPGGLEGGGQRLPEPAAGVPASSGWENVVYLPCRDGKHRPVEPGLEPLVDRTALGVGSLRAWSTWRNGTLRGYGNAIVAEVAAVFILACMDALALSR
jgi:DNA (cytosine-5)-methyltransferase 1